MDEFLGEAGDWDGQGFGLGKDQAHKEGVPVVQGWIIRPQAGIVEVDIELQILDVACRGTQGFDVFAAITERPVGGTITGTNVAAGDKLVAAAGGVIHQVVAFAGEVVLAVFEGHFHWLLLVM